MTAAYYYDSFDRTGSSLGTSEAPWTEDSGAWETVGGAQAASKGSGGRASLDLGSKNQWLEFEWTLPNANELPSVNVRSSDGLTSGSYYQLLYLCKDFADGAYIKRVVSGTPTSLAFDYPFGNTNATKRWNLLVWDQGASSVMIQAQMNGKIVLEYLDTTSRLTSGNYMFIHHVPISPAACKFEYMTARAAEAESSFPQPSYLKGQWRLNEAAGANNAIDDSGNGHDMTQVSSPGAGTGIESGCRNFDGANDYFYVADHADLSHSSAFTFACWTYRTQNTNRVIAAKWNYDVGADGWALQYDRIYVGSSTEWTFAAAPSPSMGWQHYVVAVDDTKSTDAERLRVYINGVLQVLGGGATVVVNDNADDLCLGYFQGLSRYWHGDLDLAQYWNGIQLTQAEVRDLFNAGAGLVYTASAGSAIKTINGLAIASVKTRNGLAIASMKTLNGLA